MPPFAGSNPPSNGFHKPSSPNSGSNIVTIDVGGQLFQTTKQTLSLAGSKSILSKLCISVSDQTIPFIDRDPELFSIMLSLLRTGNLPSKAKAFDIQDLIFEAKYYGIEQILVNSQSNPSQFEAFNLEKSMVLPLNGRDSPSAIAATENGSLHIAHGSKVTSFDWSMQRKSTILTQFTAIDSLLALSAKLVAAGATDFSGLQVLDVSKGVVRKSLNWENVTRSSSTVQAIGASPEFLFTSFESGRRNSNCIMVYDLRDDLRPVSMMGHYEIYGAELHSAIPSTKLRWVESRGLLMASGSHSGPSGVSGNIRLWDVRTGDVAWELKEKTDCFADVTVSDTLSSIFKVGVNSGEVYFADLRCIGTGSTSWVCLGDERKANNAKKEGVGAKIESHGDQVFCSKGGSIELWSEILMDGSDGGENRVFRKNVMGRGKYIGGSRVTSMGFGGNKMFVSRKDQQCVEVWQSSARGGL